MKNKDMKTTIKAATAQGFTVTQTRNNRLKWVSPHGGAPIISSLSEDPRNFKNHLARLRQLGFKG